MRVGEIQPGDMIVSIGPVQEVTYPLVESGEPKVVRIKGHNFVLTVPAYCDINVVRGDDDES